MKFFQVSKDGGEESHVWGYFLCEIKSLFSIVLLRFEDGSRDAYHNHAFNSVSWVLSGRLLEEKIGRGVGSLPAEHRPSLLPVVTFRSTFHKVTSFGRSWVLSFRGPWSDTWNENVGGKEITLTNGRSVVDSRNS